MRRYHAAIGASNRCVDDSKRLSAADRELLAMRIRRRALAIGIGAASSREIDRLNIYHATTRAMQRALARLPSTPHHVLVDGPPISALGVPHGRCLDGDGGYGVAWRIHHRAKALGLTSGVAWRCAIHTTGGTNAGYATSAHIGALDLHGATPHHRRSFCVRQLKLDI